MIKTLALAASLALLATPVQAGYGDLVDGKCLDYDEFKKGFRFTDMVEVDSERLLVDGGDHGPAGMGSYSAGKTVVYEIENWRSDTQWAVLLVRYYRERGQQYGGFEQHRVCVLDTGYIKRPEPVPSK